MRPKNALILFGCSLIWGTAFVAQSVGNSYMKPLTFIAARCILSAGVLAALFAVRSRAAAWRRRSGDRNVPVYNRKHTLYGGFFCGLFLTGAMILQQWGLIGAKTGIGGFLTAMYIVLVPALSFFTTGRTSAKTWVSVAVAVTGLYFMCVTGAGSQLSIYDGMLIACAFLFSLQIMCIDRFASDADAVGFSMMQFLTCAVITTPLAIILESPTPAQLHSGWFMLVYTGVFSGGVAYTLQIVGQKGQDPSLSSLLMSLESVVSLLSAWLLQGQELTSRELAGCILMFLAIVLAQLPVRPLKKAQARKRRNETDR